MPWQIDNTHSHIGFAVRHMMVSTVRGQFHGYSGTVHIDEQDPTKSWAEGEIDVNSIDTREANRDAHLRSADFFDVERHPKIAFKSRRIESLGGEEFKVYGDLTIRGVTREVALDVTYSGTAKDPWGGTRSGFSVSGTIDRKEFGLVWNALLETGGVAVANKVKLELEVELVYQAAPVEAAA